MFLQVASTRDAAVTLIADTDEGRIPVGFLGGNMPQDKMLIISEVIWFPEARPRHRIATVANFINELRDEMVVFEYADNRPASKSADGMNSKAFFEHLCRYGIMRRVGTVHDFYGQGNSAALFQSRKRKN